MMSPYWIVASTLMLANSALSATSPSPSVSLSPKAKAPKVSAKTELPAILQEIEKKYSAAGTVVAEFQQVSESAALKQKKTSKGLIMIKRPNKIRWEEREPDPSIFVTDGKRFWHYSPPFDEGEPGKLIERKSSSVHSRLANALLAGRFSEARGMKVTPQGDNGFLLMPKPGTAGQVVRTEISVDPEKKIIQSVVLDHKGGNRSMITLSNVELGKILGDDIFKFVAPPNTDRVTE